MARFAPFSASLPGMEQFQMLQSRGSPPMMPAQQESELPRMGQLLGLLARSVLKRTSRSSVAVGPPSLVSPTPVTGISRPQTAPAPEPTLPAPEPVATRVEPKPKPKKKPKPFVAQDSVFCGGGT